MADDGSQDFREKMRLCPTCRMEISFLATKCRFCGESVGRPKEEARQLSIQDLGGESGAEFALSESVVEALEAFRKEEMTQAAQPTDEKGTWFRRKPAKPTVHKRPSGGFTSVHKYTPPKDESNLTRKAAIVGAIVAGAVLLYIGGGFVKARVDDYMARKNQVQQVTFNNPAIAVLEKNGPAIEALRLAREALRATDTSDTRKVLDRAREAVKKEAEDLLNAKDWSVNCITQASNLVAEALRIDPESPLLKELQTAVAQEAAAYKMTLDSLDPDKGTAVVRIIYPEPGREPDLVVKNKGGVVGGRFEIKNIARDYVRFEDKLRKNDKGLPRQFYLYKVGTITVD